MGVPPVQRMYHMNAAQIALIQPTTRQHREDRLASLRLFASEHVLGAARSPALDHQPNLTRL